MKSFYIIFDLDLDFFILKKTKKGNHLKRFNKENINLDNFYVSPKQKSNCFY